MVEFAYEYHVVVFEDGNSNFLHCKGDFDLGSVTVRYQDCGGNDCEEYLAKIVPLFGDGRVPENWEEAAEVIFNWGARCNHSVEEACAL